MGRVTWSVTPASSLPLRCLWYASMAIWLGFGALAVGTAGLLAVAALLAGDPGPALLVGLLLLVGGPLSVLYVWPMLADPAQRPDFLTPGPWVRPRWLAVGAVLVVSLVLVVPAAAVALFAVAIASGVLAALGRSEGAVDPDAGRVVTDGRPVDLDSLAGVARMDLPRIAVLWLRYPRSAGTAMAPRLLVVPGAMGDRVVASIEEGIDPTAADPDTRSSRTVRLALLVLGLGSLALGVALHLVGPVPPAVALWGSGLFGLFGLLFLWLAAVE